MSWSVYVAYDSANNTDDSTAPGAKFGRVATAWGASSALAFFSDQSQSAVTVGEYPRESALITNTTDATTPRYVTNIRPNVGLAVSTGFLISTPSDAGEAYMNRDGATDYATPKPSYGPRFEFTTAGSVSFTAASAWFGKVNASGVVEQGSAEAGFRCALAELATSDSWQMGATSGAKISLNCDAANGGRQRAEYQTTLGAGWWFAISLSPKSAGVKTGGVAINITYS
jgi:hypothetical protein